MAPKIIQVVLKMMLLLHCMSNVLSCSNCFPSDHEATTPRYSYLDVDHGHHRTESSGSSIPYHANGLYDLGNSGLGLTRRLLGSPSSSLSSGKKKVSVDNFGAKGDGKSDDTEAFEKAWKEACSSERAVLVIPQKRYLLKPIWFSGPCEDDLRVVIRGTLEASDDRSDYSKDGRHWLIFDKVNNLVVEGGGTINGKGKIWWKNSCKINKSLPCKKAPTAVTFYKCKNLIVKNLKVKNAQQIHISFEDSYNVQASKLVVASPGNSPNTDGIHITNTQNIKVSDCTIGTGDDCISIVSGSQTVQANDITCGPGHGISIGSLGKGNSDDHVSGVSVNNAKFSGTSNGVRIKTWQGGSGSANNIKFQNIEMKNVTNPIIIDQNYCDQDDPCKEENSAVNVKNVVYRNIKGTSASDIAVKFDCSKAVPCRGIVLQDIDLDHVDGGNTDASCSNVKYSNLGGVSPRCN